MKRMRFTLFRALWPVLFATAAAADALAEAERPRLIVQLTIDQLRGDMLLRHRDDFTPEGFRRLMEHGLYYTNAHYGTANTFTASGHAVLVTGADTAEHGMVANEWFDRESGKSMYATFDPRHGQSPLNLTSTTIADEIVSSSPSPLSTKNSALGVSRAFAIAGKDRSAIIPGGHLGKAYWLNDKDGGLTTSTYYYASMPAWVQAWNKRKLIDRYRSSDWTLSKSIAAYHNAVANPHARPGALGPAFPHSLKSKSDKAFITAFRNTPFLDEHTLAFARTLIAEEKVGQGTATDYLSISLSGNDYVGHAFGPESVEYEDNLIRLDRNLADFLTFLDKILGKDRYLVVLSADHGIADIPENAHDQGFDADRFDPQLLIEKMNTALNARFNSTDDLIAAFSPPSFYLTQQSAPNTEIVASALAEELRKVPGVAYAFTRTDILAGKVPNTEMCRRVARSYHPSRSGDVVIIQKQHWYLYHDSKCCASMHGSPYSYDTFVPVIFYGPGIPARTIARPIEPGSIAPTLATLLSIKPPTGNVAPVLTEVFER